MTVTSSPNVSKLVGNTAGNVQTLPDQAVGGKERCWIERQGIPNLLVGDMLCIARIQCGSYMAAIEITSDTSFGNGQFCIGDRNNASRFVAAGTFTSTDTPTDKLRASAKGVAIATPGWDQGATGTVASGNNLYDDIMLICVTSSFSAGGTFTVITKYIDYGA